MGKTCVIYARISSRNKVDSLEAQIEKCNAYARKRNLIAQEAFRDECSGYSTPLHRRPGLLAMMEYLRGHQETKIVLVRDISRLSRSVLQGLYLLHWLQLQGVAIHDIDMLETSSNTSIEPSNSWEYRKELQKRLINAEDYVHSHTKDEQDRENDDRLFMGKTPPFGYEKHYGILKKRKDAIPLVEEVFSIVKDYLNSEGMGKEPVSYKNIFDGIKDKAEFIGVKQKIATRKESITLERDRSLKGMLQNPYYAGFSSSSTHKTKPPVKRFQKPDDRIHEYYISVEDYNRLNMGYRSIDLPQKKKPSFVSLITCQRCGGHLHKKDDRAICRASGKSVIEKTLVEQIADNLRKYYMDIDNNFVRNMLSYFRKDKLEKLLRSIQEQLENYELHSEAVIEDMSLTSRSVEVDDVVIHLRNIRDEIEKMKSTRSNELSVLWLLAYHDGKGRAFLENFDISIIHDFDSQNLVLTMPEEASIKVHENEYRKEEMKQEFNHYQNSRENIKRMIDEMPGIKAALEYDAGFASGDFWTDYNDAIFTHDVDP